MGSHFCRCAACCYAHLQNLISSVSRLWKIKTFFFSPLVCCDCFADVTKLISFQIVLQSKSELIERWRAHLARIFSCFVWPHPHSKIDFSILFFFGAFPRVNSLTSVISCSLPSLKRLHTPPWVHWDIHNHVSGLCACTYVAVVSQLCASVHRRVHSLSTDTPLSFHPDASVWWIQAQWWVADKSIPCQCFHCRQQLGLLFQKAVYQMPRDCEWRQKLSLKLHHERNIGSEAAEAGNKWERNGVNHAASVCVSGYQVTYLTPRRRLEQTGELTVSVSVLSLNSTGQNLSFSLFMPLMLSVTPIKSILLHEMSWGTAISRHIMPYIMHLLHLSYEIVHIMAAAIQYLDNFLIQWSMFLSMKCQDSKKHSYSPRRLGLSNGPEPENVKFTVTGPARSHMFKHLSRFLFL